MPGFPRWSPSLMFPRQNTVLACFLPHTSYIPRPSHLSRFYYPHNIGIIYTYTYIYIYIYICVCVCVCVCIHSFI
jgi:hypothetical protein